jgi:hypothetical protein
MLCGTGLDLPPSSTNPAQALKTFETKAGIEAE